MTVNLLALATELSDSNPATSQLIVDLDNAETGSEIMTALELYDNTATN